MVQEVCSMSACIIVSVSPPSYPNIIISITGIKSEPQTLCPRSVSKQQSRDSHLDLADNKPWTFDHHTVFFHEVCPGSLRPQFLSSLIFIDASSLPGAQTQHLLRIYSWGLPGTTCGARQVSSR